MSLNVGVVSVSVAVLDDYQHVALEFADWGAPRRPGVGLQAFSDHLADEDALRERLAPFDIVVSMRERTPFPRSLLERLGNLKLLVTTGMVNAAIDVAAATAGRHHRVGDGRSRLSHRRAHLGSHLRPGPQHPRRGRQYPPRRWQTGIGPELGGRTLGVIGLGHLGRQVATVGRAFDMDVIAGSQNLTPAHAERVGASWVTKDELLGRSDVVTIHLKLSERTHGLIGKRELALMRPSAYLINTSRGPIVDEAALVQALGERRIVGAASTCSTSSPSRPTTRCGRCPTPSSPPTSGT